MGVRTDSIVMTDNLATVLEIEVDRLLGHMSDMSPVDAACSTRSAFNRSSPLSSKAVQILRGSIVSGFLVLHCAEASASTRLPSSNLTSSARRWGRQRFVTCLCNPGI